MLFMWTPLCIGSRKDLHLCMAETIGTLELDSDIM
jgi:hypothetical protein